MDLSNVTWRKASYSGGNGGNCVEVGVCRKASYSGANGGECVEAASAAKAMVAVRDSKDPDGPKLAFTSPAWRSFIELSSNTALGRS